MLVPLMVIMVCLKTATAENGDPNWENHSVDLYKKLYNFGLGKRAYSYVSEYKRLPVYNFGLGKRSRQYNFGLGKKSEKGEEEVATSYNQDANMKRIRPYNFGLGKRAGMPRQYNFGLGKKSGRLYSFGLGKRAQTYSPLYTFETLPRTEEEMLAELLLGEDEYPRYDLDAEYPLALRLPEPQYETAEYPVQYPVRSDRSLHYNFGLGKREDQEGAKLHQTPSKDTNSSA